jgi:hypothetical protein
MNGILNGTLRRGNSVYDWALEFDAKMKDLILSDDHKAMIDSSKLMRSSGR